MFGYDPDYYRNNLHTWTIACGPKLGIRGLLRFSEMNALAAQRVLSSSQFYAAYAVPPDRNYAICLRPVQVKARSCHQDPESELLDHLTQTIG